MYFSKDVGFAMSNVLNPNDEDKQLAVAIRIKFGENAERIFLERGWISLQEAHECAREYLNDLYEWLGLE